MPAFEKYFFESKGKPVIVDGRLIHLADFFEVVDGQKVRVVFESAKSDRRQGASLSGKVDFIVNEQVGPNGVVLWSDTAPREVVLEVRAKAGTSKTKPVRCMVRNVWEASAGFMDSGHNGAAMIVEELPRGKRYWCNDGRPNDDFDDIVFTLEVLE